MPFERTSDIFLAYTSIAPACIGYGDDAVSDIAALVLPLRLLSLLNNDPAENARVLGLLRRRELRAALTLAPERLARPDTVRDAWPKATSP